MIFCQEEFFFIFFFLGTIRTEMGCRSPDDGKQVIFGRPRPINPRERDGEKKANGEKRATCDTSIDGMRQCHPGHLASG